MGRLSRSSVVDGRGWRGGDISPPATPPHAIVISQCVVRIITKGGHVLPEAKHPRSKTIPLVASFCTTDIAVWHQACSVKRAEPSLVLSVWQGRCVCVCVRVSKARTGDLGELKLNHPTNDNSAMCREEGSRTPQNSVVEPRRSPVMGPFPSID